MMELTKHEQSMFNGELGEAARQSMEILIALGKIYGAQSMIPVSSVQVAGVSYKTIGDAGLEYLQDMNRNGAKVKVPTFLNPAGMDRKQWKSLGIPETFAKKQIKVLDSYEAMGITMSCTCTPYLIGNRPKLREHIAWSESSAVAFANSVLGARTNREGGPSALAAAICGVTPNYGLHLEENRISNFVVAVETELKTTADFGALGSFVGEACKSRHPSFTGIRMANEDKLKVLGASMAASGSTALFYIENITPEFVLSDSPEKISFTQKELKETKEKLGTEGKPELVTIGCPHASLDEIRDVAKFVKGKSLACQLWVCTANETKQGADAEGYTNIIEQSGGRVVADTCMVVCPIEQMGYKTTGSNSGKAAKYLPSFCKQKVAFGDLEELLRFK